MSDTDDEIRTLLRQMADDEEFEPVPLVPLMTRGRRGLFRRRVFTTVVAGAAVAAVAMAASTLPNLAGPRQEPPVAASTRLPGVQPGDAALQPVAMTEALRRCRLQWSAVAGQDVGAISPTSTFVPQKYTTEVSGTAYPGRVQTVINTRSQVFSCLIPGDYEPPATDLALAAGDAALPTDDAGLLRRCSTTFWHDLSGWQVVARQVDGNTLAQAVVLSPSRRYVAHCTVTAPTLREAILDGPAKRPAIEAIEVIASPAPTTTARQYNVSTLADSVFGVEGGSACAKDTKRCSSWLFYGSGRTPAQVNRMELQAGGKVESIEVTDGWFAVAFEVAVTDAAGRPGKIGPLTAYDDNGAMISSAIFISVLTR